MVHKFVQNYTGLVFRNLEFKRFYELGIKLENRIIEKLDFNFNNKKKTGWTYALPDC